jgi:hypothetical protein
MRAELYESPHQHVARQWWQGDARADRDVFLGAFGNDLLNPLEDQAIVTVSALSRHGDRFAFATDSFVVDSLFFPGGDIGTLAVSGTVNELAVSGAKPLFVSCWMVLGGRASGGDAATDLRQHAHHRRPCRCQHRYGRYQTRRARGGGQTVHRLMLINKIDVLLYIRFDGGQCIAFAREDQPQGFGCLFCHVCICAISFCCAAMIPRASRSISGSLPY